MPNEVILRRRYFRWKEINWEYIFQIDIINFNELFHTSLGNLSPNIKRIILHFTMIVTYISNNDKYHSLDFIGWLCRYLLMLTSALLVTKFLLIVMQKCTSTVYVWTFRVYQKQKTCHNVQGNVCFMIYWL